MANQNFVFTDAMEVVGIVDRKRILIMNRLGNVGFKETLEKTASIIHTFRVTRTITVEQLNFRPRLLLQKDIGHLQVCVEG